MCIGNRQASPGGHRPYIQTRARYHAGIERHLRVQPSAARRAGRERTRNPVGALLRRWQQWTHDCCVSIRRRRRRQIASILRPYRLGQEAQAGIDFAVWRPVFHLHLEEMVEHALQVDHRVPYEIAGEPRQVNPDEFMLLCGSANRAKSWSCEHCDNWRQLKRRDVCASCYWAFPEDYQHVAMNPRRRLDLLW